MSARDGQSWHVPRPGLPSTDSDGDRDGDHSRSAAELAECSEAWERAVSEIARVLVSDSGNDAASLRLTSLVAAVRERAVEHDTKGGLSTLLRCRQRQRSDALSIVQALRRVVANRQATKEERQRRYQQRRRAQEQQRRVAQRAQQQSEQAPQAQQQRQHELNPFFIECDSDSDDDSDS